MYKVEWSGTRFVEKGLFSKLIQDFKQQIIVNENRMKKGDREK